MDLVIGKRQQPTRNQSLKTNNQNRAAWLKKEQEASNEHEQGPNDLTDGWKTATATNNQHRTFFDLEGYGGIIVPVNRNKMPFRVR